MTKLPTWIEGWADLDCETSLDDKMYDALSLAWEALSQIKTIPCNCESNTDCQFVIAKAALSRIQKLGEE